MGGLVTPRKRSKEAFARVGFPAAHPNQAEPAGEEFIERIECVIDQPNSCSSLSFCVDSRARLSNRTKKSCRAFFVGLKDFTTPRDYMSLAEALIDDKGHHFACHRYHKEPSSLGSHSTYCDYFCECHTFKEPKVLANGTDVAWPAAWDQDLVDSWRRDNNLVNPANRSAS